MLFNLLPQTYSDLNKSFKKIQYFINKTPPFKSTKRKEKNLYFHYSNFLRNTKQFSYVHAKYFKQRQGRLVIYQNTTQRDILRSKQGRSLSTFTQISFSLINWNRWRTTRKHTADKHENCSHEKCRETAPYILSQGYFLKITFNVSKLKMICFKLQS